MNKEMSFLVEAVISTFNLITSYRERKGKTDLEDDPEEDTITYHMINTWYFDEELSKPLTGDEIIVIPHLVILVSRICDYCAAQSSNRILSSIIIIQHQDRQIQ